MASRHDHNTPGLRRKLQRLFTPFARARSEPCEVENFCFHRNIFSVSLWPATWKKPWTEHCKRFEDSYIGVFLQHIPPNTPASIPTQFRINAPPIAR